MTEHDKSADPSPLSADLSSTTRALVNLALRGLGASFIPGTMEFAQTVRAMRDATGVTLAAEGTNVRYAAIVALGLATVPASVQRTVLSGRTVDELVASVALRARTSADVGAVALAAWATAEVTGVPDDVLLQRLHAEVTSGRALPTVDGAWMLTAAVASLRRRNGTDMVAAELIRHARDRLLRAQGAQGIFPHALPAVSLGRWRAHVGCFADQVYPIQALARLAQLTDDLPALASANRAASRISELQGDAGQWWWHYDTRDGSVIEGYPVYSVHQHAMGPMALLDLAAAGGDDHTASIARGLDWLTTHPEVPGGARWGDASPPKPPASFQR